MGINPKDPLVEIKITIAVCSFVAIITTGYRLWIRRGRYWLDDGWAMFALLTLIIQIVAVFLHVPVPNNLTRTARVAAYYMTAYTFYSVIWASRLSILYSLIRVDPNPNRRRYLTWVSWVFLAAALVLMGQLLWVCEPEPKWKDAPNPQCQLPEQVAISQLVTDILADMTLLFVPLRMFQVLQSRALRKKLSLIFSTCVATTIVSLVHASLIFEDAGIKIIVAALVEDCVSLIVCNIPVVVGATMGVTSSSEESDQVSTYTVMSFKKNPNISSKSARSGSTTILSWFSRKKTINPGASTTITMDGLNTRIGMSDVLVTTVQSVAHDNGQSLGQNRGRGTVHDMKQTSNSRSFSLDRGEEDSEMKRRNDIV